MRNATQIFLLRATVLGTLMVLSVSTAFAQITPGTNVNTSKMTADQSECTIAKNPTNKLQLFILCNNTDGPGLFAAYSTDGGTMWNYPDPSKTIANGNNAALGPAACCDPSLAWDTFGNLYIVYIDNTLQYIEVLVSTTGGMSFSNLTSFGPAGVDQPHVAAAAGAVWVVWSQSGQMVGSGAPVTGLGAVGSFIPQQTIPGATPCDFGDVAISPAGTVVQVCMSPYGGAGPSNLFVNTNPGGLSGTFGAVVTASSTNVGGWDFIPPQSARSVDAEPNLAYDRNPASPHFGRLYMAYTDSATVSSQATNIYVRYSDNDGGAWSSPIQVNDDASGRSHFWPRIASNPLSGNIAVCWHDCRNSATDTAVQQFCTIATPTGAAPSFMPNAAVSGGASTSNKAGVEFGDYAGLAYFQGLAHPAWADTSNSTGDNPNGTANFDAYSNRVSGGAAAHEGDPHLTTINGVHYDFQSAGEFTVLRDYDGLEIQTRQSPIATTFTPGADPHDQLATCVSLNTAVAARVGSHRVSYEPNLNGVPDPSGLQLRVDGALTTLPASGINLGNGARVGPSSAPGSLEIDFPDETVAYVIPSWWASQSRWYLNLEVDHTPALEGTLGVIPKSTWLPALPDGAVLGAMPPALHQRYLDLYRTFADAWRVTDRTSLFDYAPGTSTSTFTLRSWPPEAPPCVLPDVKPVEPASAAVAEEACRRIRDANRHADCIFDVTLAGNTGFAETYFLSQRVQADSTTTTLSGQPDPSQIGEWVKFTAAVTANSPANRAVPAGAVQFTVDGTKAGEPVPLDSFGRASWETARLPFGSHSISAAYIPGAGSPFLASTSPETSHTVKRCPCDSATGRK